MHDGVADGAIARRSRFPPLLSVLVSEHGECGVGICSPWCVRFVSFWTFAFLFPICFEI